MRGMTTALLIALILGAGASERGAEEVPDFALDVRPLLARRCFACHGNDEETREAGLRLDVRAEAVADRGGFPAIAPGDAEGSELFARIADDVDPMPPEHSGEMLEEHERELLRRWIDGGAPYAEHWAFVPPSRPEVPVIDGASQPIDAFVREALHARGLQASAPADELTLLRRLSLDLTGLPPTVSEARAFAASTDPDKLEATIERYLASPAASERWAAVWLDLARYADSAGHGSDPLRTIWRYRDWLIEAFDRNLPFDEFTVQQLAGDLLPDAGTDERLATAFHRNTMTNTEGGTDDEEFRVLAVKDRVNTTMQVWMGLTAGCAECHSHKYDPISHREYYELFALFNQTADNDRGDEAPLLDTPTAAQLAEFEELGVGLESARAALAARRAELAGDPLQAEMLLARGRASAAAFDRSAVAGVVADEGETVATLEGGAWLVESSRDKATRRLTVNPIDDAPGALRIDALAAEGLPGGGPGRSGGNFVLTSLRVRALPAPGDSAPLVQRVRVELPGKQRILSLAEVQLVGAEGSVLDAEISASQSSTAYGGDPGRAVDGETDGAYEAGSVTHTATEDDPWWEGRLAAPAKVAGVRLWTRTDGDLESRLHGLRVVLLDGAGSEVWRSAPAPAFGPSCDIGPALGEPLLLEVAGATHEQAGFEARGAVDARLTDRDGWAVAGGTGRDQSAVFLLPELGGPRGLEVTLEHAWGGRHVLGAFAAAVAPRRAEALTILSDATVAALAAAPDSRTPAQRRAVEDALGREDETAASLTARVDELEAARKAVGVVRTPVMEELPADRRRDTHVLVRGNFMQKAEQVHAAVPSAFGALPGDAPLDRLSFARWLVSPENPLTARVAVNRVWARLFGRGLVPTEGDFGSQGELPSHPALLDWLAAEFVSSGWDHRALLRTIVSSETYRQASVMDSRGRELDPDGTWLSRYPRQRLEAEMVRDTTLRAAGLLSAKRFGPSVFPPQPDGLWQAAFNGQRNWQESMGEDRYRRGLYVFLRRTIPYPMLATFDAPSRELCSIQRIPTNTPLQAFVTLNDPVFVEAAQALGRELSAMDEEEGVRATIRELLWRVTARPPMDAQVEELVDLQGFALEEFGSDEGAARAFAEEPLGALPEGAHVGRAAAWTLVASTALNMDAVLTKE